MLVWKCWYGGGVKEWYFVSIYEYFVVYVWDILFLEELFVDFLEDQIKCYYKFIDVNLVMRGLYWFQLFELVVLMGDCFNLCYLINVFDGSEIWLKCQWFWVSECVELVVVNGEFEFK